MSKLIVILILGLYISIPVHAVPMSHKLATATGQSDGAGDAAATDQGNVDSITPGVRNYSAPLVTEAMTPPRDNLGVIEDAVRAIVDVPFDADLDAPPDFDTASDFDAPSDFDGVADTGGLPTETRPVVVTEPAALLLWLAGLVALFARRR